MRRATPASRSLRRSRRTWPAWRPARRRQQPARVRHFLHSSAFPDQSFSASRMMALRSAKQNIDWQLSSFSIMASVATRCKYDKMQVRYTWLEVQQPCICACAGALAKSGDYLAGIDMPSSGSEEESYYRSDDSGSAPATAAAAERECSSAGPADGQADGKAAALQGGVEGSSRTGAAPEPAGGPAESVPGTLAATERLSRLGVDS